MEKLDFKSKKIITILGVMVILLVVVVFFWLNNTSSPLSKSSHLEIIDDPKNILYSQLFETKFRNSKDREKEIL